MHIDTIAVHAGRRVDPTTGAVAPPLHLSTTFERDAEGGYPSGFSYSRENNPNRAALETCLAALEGGVAAVAYASGMAASVAALEALGSVRPGPIMLPRDAYYGMRSLMSATAFGRRLDAIVVDMTDLDALEHACADRKPGIVWLETPSNPLVSVTDLAAAAAIARASGAMVAVDNTWATPLLQRPLALGADLVVHSLTKYVGGHGDVMAGIAVVRDAGPHLDELRAIQRLGGALPSPFDCWLALRGTASLPARLAMHCANAMAAARFLDRSPMVSKVHYPGLESHPGHAIAKRQMRGFGGMLSFEVLGCRAEAMAVTAALKLITRATSLGSSHSLIEHRASIEGPETTAPEALLRLSVGLEHADDLIADLDQALGVLRTG